jgi:hypothetical protein
MDGVKTTLTVSKQGGFSSEEIKELESYVVINGPVKMKFNHIPSGAYGTWFHMASLGLDHESRQMKPIFKFAVEEKANSIRTATALDSPGLAETSSAARLALPEAVRELESIVSEQLKMSKDELNGANGHSFGVNDNMFLRYRQVLKGLNGAIRVYKEEKDARAFYERIAPISHRFNALATEFVAGGAIESLSKMDPKELDDLLEREVDNTAIRRAIDAFNDVVDAIQTEAGARLADSSRVILSPKGEESGFRSFGRLRRPQDDVKLSDRLRGYDRPGLLVRFSGIEAPSSDKLSAGEREALKAFIVEVASRQNSVGRALSVLRDEGFADVLKFKQYNHKGLEIIIEGEKDPITIENLTADLQALRSGKRTQEEKIAGARLSAQGYLTFVKLGRIGAETALPALVAASPYAIEIPMTFLKNAALENLEQTLQIFIAQILELKNNPRYAKATFLLNTETLAQDRRDLVEGIVSAQNVDFLRIGKAADFKGGIAIQFIDAGSADAIVRQSHIVTLSMSGEEQDPIRFLWSAPFVMASAAAAVYGNTSVFDKDTRSIDDAKVNAEDLKKIYEVYSRNISEEIKADFDLSRFRRLLREETSVSIFRTYAFKLPVIDKNVVSTLLSIAHTVLKAVGGAA